MQGKQLFSFATRLVFSAGSAVECSVCVVWSVFGQCWAQSTSLGSLSTEIVWCSTLSTGCPAGLHSCFSCKQSEGEVQRCMVQQCGRFYHEACARLSALSIFESKGFRCPLHTCLSCYYSTRSKLKATKGEVQSCTVFLGFSSQPKVRVMTPHCPHGSCSPPKVRPNPKPFFSGYR